MPAERTTMRQVREIVRLHLAGVSTRQIGIRVGVAASTVRLTLRRVAAAGMAESVPADQTDAALEKVVFTGAGKKTGHRRHPDPDWPAIHQDLKRKHVTLTIVWDEYIARHPDGYRYSRFCELYRSWEARLSVTMRQSHRAGEKLFVDYAGDVVPVVIDRLTGERRVSYANGRIIRWIEAQNPHPSVPAQKAVATPQALPVIVVPAFSEASFLAFVARLPLPLLACGVGFCL